MKINKKSTGSAPVFTQEGGRAKKITPYWQLRRSILATMLWENSFYESGEEISKRILGLIPQVPADEVASLAIETRNSGKLRHVPLLLARAMAALPTHRAYVNEVLTNVIQRPDELAEFLAIYWKEKKQPLSAQVKKGLANAFVKFDEYQLAKYNRDSAIKLRDVLFLCHAKPVDKAQEKLWKRLVNNELKTPDTWEVAISAATASQKKGEWERLLKEGKLGGLALLRNLRNFKQEGVNESLIRKALADLKVDRVLPYRFITAAKYAPNLEPELESAMFRSIESKGSKINGKTVFLIDVSGSMDTVISAKSDATRLDAACALSILGRELFSDVEVYTFSNDTVQVPSRRGFALRDAIIKSQSHGGTYLGNAVSNVAGIPYERLIVFTDEQSAQSVPDPRKNSKGYVVNVASEKNGVGYGAWNHIDGFSESVLEYILAYEQMLSQD
jgi:60 kDa SS-A/Ro ribonucleoprotein